MESVNIIKGYGKISPVDGLPNPPPNRRRKIIVALSLAALLLMTVAIVSVVIVAIIESATESDESDPSQFASNSSEALRTVCAVTRYPDSCFSSISPLNSPPSNDPLRFFSLSVHASTIALSGLKSAISKPEADPTMKECAELFDDAESKLSRSADSIPAERTLNESLVSNLQTWVSAAMTDLETCLDGLEERETAAGSEFTVRVRSSQECMSNTLAVLNNIHSLFKKFGLRMP